MRNTDKKLSNEFNKRRGFLNVNVGINHFAKLDEIFPGEMFRPRDVVEKLIDDELFRHRHGTANLQHIHDVNHHKESPWGPIDLILTNENQVIAITPDKVMMFQTLEEFNIATELPEDDHIIWREFSTVK